MIALRSAAFLRDFCVKQVLDDLFLIPSTMEKKTKTELPDAFLWLKDAPPQPIATERFTAEQMIDCDACHRKNPPTRLACMYCGAKLNVSEENAAFVRPMLRKLENWEKGWNVVWIPPPTQDVTKENPKEELGQVAKFLRLERNELDKILSSGQALPLARAESSEEADVIVKYLQNHNLTSAVVPDAELQIEALPKRVRSLEFGGSYLNLFLLNRAEEQICLFYAEIKVLVFGALLERQVENRERRKSEERFEIKDSREISSDESILDFYPQGDPTGYRISMRNFDFSCLGDEKKMLASENFKILLEKLRVRAPNAVFDDSYYKVRPALNLIWQPEQRNESRGWMRDGVGKFSIENRLTVSNNSQFMRYSRMLYQLKSR